MYIFQRLRQLYETSNPSSTEYILSRYVLLNIKQLSELSVSTISSNTSMSKSAVSKFFKSLSYDKGFTQFKASLEFELQFIIIDYQTLISDGSNVKNIVISLPNGNKFTLSEYVNRVEIEKLARVLKNKNKIIFCGNDSKKSFFHQLINCLIIDGKDAKFATWIYSEQQSQELSMLDTSSVLIVVEPENTIYDFKFRYSLSVEMPSVWENIKAEIYYLGRSSKAENGIHIINLNTTRQIFYDDMLLTYFVSQLLVMYLGL